MLVDHIAGSDSVVTTLLYAHRQLVLCAFLASVRVHVPLLGVVIRLCIIRVGGAAGGHVFPIFRRMTLDAVVFWIHVSTSRVATCSRNCTDGNVTNCHENNNGFHLFTP